MRLSNKTLKKFVKGAISFTEERGYLFCSRYSEAQRELMAHPDYDWGWRMRADFSGGIRIEFETDATALSFDYKASHSHPRSNTVDLYIDGVLCSVYKIEEKYKGTVSFDLPEGYKRVCIFLPCECRFDIKNFTINGGYKSIKDKGKRLLVIGDSITQGAGPDISSASYINTLARETDFIILGQGVGGYRYEPCDLMRVDGFEPDKIMVFLGTNYYDISCLERGYDYKLAIEEFYSRLTELYPTTPIYSVTPLWRNNDVDFERLLWCIDTIKSTCAKYKNVTVIDGFKLLPNVDVCLSDGVHPSTYGSLILATNLIKELSKSI